MRVLIVGASGLIGSAVAARLVGRGDSVLALSRSGAAPGLTGAAQIRLDMARTTNPAAWLPHLAGIDAVVNCAGILQDSFSDSTTGVHAPWRGGPVPVVWALSR